MKTIKLILAFLTKLPYSLIGNFFQNIPQYITEFDKLEDLTGFQKLEKVVRVVEDVVKQWLPKDKAAAASTVATIIVAAVRLYQVLWKK
jgi:hypothetical protein